MADQIEQLILITQLKDMGDYESALAACEIYISKYSSKADGYRVKADILELLENYTGELEVREKLIDLGSVEPADYYDLSRLSFEIGDSESAVKYSDICITKCEELDNYYYFQSAHFWKAIALISLSCEEEALQHWNELDRDYKNYVRGKGIVTKKMLETYIFHAINKKVVKKKIWRFGDDSSDGPCTP